MCLKTETDRIPRPPESYRKALPPELRPERKALIRSDGVPQSAHAFLAPTQAAKGASLTHRYCQHSRAKPRQHKSFKNISVQSHICRIRSKSTVNKYKLGYVFEELRYKFIHRTKSLIGFELSYLSAIDSVVSVTEAQVFCWILSWILSLSLSR